MLFILLYIREVNIFDLFYVMIGTTVGTSIAMENVAFFTFSSFLNPYEGLKNFFKVHERRVKIKIR